MAIQLVPSAAILETLLTILENREDDLEVKKAAAEALQIALFAVHSDMRVRIFNALRQYINDPCPELRAVALSILVPHHDAAAVQFVKDSLSGKVADSRLPKVTAIQLLAADDSRKHLNVIRPFLNVPAVQAGPAFPVVPAVPEAVVRKGLTNPGFEQPLGREGGFTFVETMPGWKTTDTQFEIWSTGFKGFEAYEGNQFVELNALIDGTLYQDATGISQGAVLEFSFAHRGRNGNDTMKLTVTDLGGDNSLGTADDTPLFSKEYTTGKNAWAVYDSTTETPILARGNTVRFAYNAVDATDGAGPHNTEGNFLDVADFGVGVVTAKPVVVAIANDDPAEVLTAAIEAIGFDPASRPLIVRHLQDRGQPLNVRRAALRAVEEDRGQAVNLAKQLVTDSTESPQLRVAAINTLGGICSSRVHELNLRSEQVAAGRRPLVIEADVPAISADGRASVYDLLKQTACSVDSPDVSAEAFRVAHWLRINDPAVRQRPQPPAARPAVPLPNQLPPVVGNFNPVPPVVGNFNPVPPSNPAPPINPGNFNQGVNPRNSINRVFGNGRNQPQQSGRAQDGNCNKPLFGTIK